MQGIEPLDAQFGQEPKKTLPDELHTDFFGEVSLPINPGFEHQPAFDSKAARRLTKEWLFEMVEEQL
ncbi:hypothetical protein [Nitrincola nitratireducens]|nr:hypothetical protein [Nitrincola nitratireducens]